MPTTVPYLWAVRRFSAVLRWEPEALLNLIYRSGVASIARTLKSGIRKKCSWLTRTAFGRLDITIKPKHKRCKMNIPGFNAELSLGPTMGGRLYRVKTVDFGIGGRSVRSLGVSPSLTPNFVPPISVHPQRFCLPRLNQVIEYPVSCQVNGVLGFKDCQRTCDIYYGLVLGPESGGGVGCRITSSTCTPEVCGDCKPGIITV